MNKFKFMYIHICLILLFVACSPTSTEQQTELPSLSLDLPKVVFMGNTQDIVAGSFDSLLIEATKSVASRLGLELTLRQEPELVDAAIPLDALRTLVDEGFDIVITGGFTNTEVMRTVALEFPDTTFIGFDQFQETSINNLTGIVYKEEQVGYMAGALAGNLTATNEIAGVYGPDIAPIVAFAEGFKAGALSVNPDIEVLSEFYSGSNDAWNDQEWGNNITQTLLDDGIDVVFSAAGQTTIGVLNATSQRASETEGLYCIGVDTDMWLTVPEAHSCLVSSALKNIPAALDDVLEQTIQGNQPAGNYFGPVDLAPFHDFDDLISDELRAELDNLRDDLADDKITISLP